MLLLAFASSCICFFEWVFLVTKPSFFGSDPFFIKLNTLLFWTSLSLLIATIIILFLIVFQVVFGRRIQKVTKSIALAISALIISSLVLLLIDNFTYVVFDFGIVSTHSWRILYLVVFNFSPPISFFLLSPKHVFLQMHFHILKQKYGGSPPLLPLHSFCA